MHEGLALTSPFAASYAYTKCSADFDETRIKFDLEREARLVELEANLKEILNAAEGQFRTQRNTVCALKTDCMRHW